MMQRLRWIWSICGWQLLIICSSIAAGLVTFLMPASTIRTVVVLWFLFVCPGLLYVRLFRVQGLVIAWMLTLALSFAIDAVVASIMLYAGVWSPTIILGILICFCLAGTLIQVGLTFFLSRLRYPRRNNVQ